jgi:alkanesulfonate monooxygenase SsuD/methylene tetrahydromethanopterin reductase-like flavin-dependent oxidoreductase (luciferase family)
VALQAFVVTGSTEEEMSAAATGARRQLAFYGSTPAYRPVLELHGWGELQLELNRLSKQGAWAEMGGLIDDEMLGRFAVVGEPAVAAAELVARFGDVLDRLSFYLPAPVGDDELAALMAGVRGSV